MPSRILVRKLEQVRQFVAARVVSLRQFRDILLSILSETLGRGSLPRAELDIISRVDSNFDTFLSLSSTCNRSNTRARSGRAAVAQQVKFIHPGCTLTRQVVRK